MFKVNNKVIVILIGNCYRSVIFMVSLLLTLKGMREFYYPNKIKWKNDMHLNWIELRIWTR